VPPPTRAWLRQQKTQQKDSPVKHGRAHPIRVEQAPIFGKGPNALRAALDEGIQTAKPGPRPTTGPLALATLPEWYIYWALTNRLHKKDGEDFRYRGETQFAQGLSGQTQLDFEMLDGSGIAIEVQGNFFHYEQGSAKLIQDQVRAQDLAPFVTVIDIDEDDALRDPEYYTREALAGHDHSFRYRNYWVKPFNQS
jgi:hypothetical protein